MKQVSSPNHSSLPIMENWGAKRKIEKHQGIGVSGHLVRTIIFVTATIFAVPYIAIASIYTIGVSLKEKYIIKFCPNHPLTAIRKMKETEQLDKFKTMAEVLYSFDAMWATQLSPAEKAKKLTQDVKAKLADPAVVQNRGARILLRLLSADSNFDKRWIELIKDPKLVRLLDFSSETPADNFIKEVQKTHPDFTLNINWAEVNQKVNKYTIDAKNIEWEAAKFKKSLRNLIQQLSKTPDSDVEFANQQFIAALRHLLKSPVYQALKEDGSQQSIQLLHEFASAIWNKAPSMNAYASVGENVIQQLNLDADETGGETLAKQLDQSREHMEKVHYAAHGLNGIGYAITHPLQILGALASEGGLARHIPGIFDLDVYDSHKLANNPSLQGVTKCTLNSGKEASIHNCYGGSPTIGDHHIAPEFEAVLMAAENNQMAPQDSQSKSIPMVVIYNNLQNLDKKDGEGPRSRTLMLLNQKYPLSFRGTTFAKDSEFYLMHDPKSVLWTDAQDFGVKMKQQLLRSFDPDEKGHGFYFHGSKDTWQPIFDAVIASASDHFDKIKLTPRELQGAYQEYVYSMLNAILEMRAVQDLADRGLEDFIVMVDTSCKENIDRGGMENTKYMYTKLDEDHAKRLALLLGVMHSRALSARDRVILKTRMPQILDFMKTTEPADFRWNLREVLDELGFEVETEYQPYLKP